MRLKDKVILVTASTRGIGLAIVKKCAEEGAKVYMAARNMERAQEITNTLTGVKCVYNDAAKPETFSSMVEDVVQDAGHIDVLVNNFGTSNPGKDLDFANTDPQVFLDTVNLNLRSVFMASQAAAKHMAVVNADSPLRPPCATPAALSMNTQAAEVPNMPDDIVAEESAMNTLFILGMLPSLSA